MEAMDRTPTDADVSLPEFTIAMRGYDRMQVDEYIGRIGRWMDEAQARTASAEQGLATLRRENQQLQHRVGELEASSDTPSAALEGIGQKMQAMLTEAMSDCDEIRQRGVDEANAAVSTARKTAVDIVERARATVRQLEEAAKADRRTAATARDEASAEADSVAAERLAAADQEAARVIDEARGQADTLLAEAEHRRVRIIEAGEQHRRAVEDEVARLIRQRDHVLNQLSGLRSALEGAISLPGGDTVEGDATVTMTKAAQPDEATR